MHMLVMRAVVLLLAALAVASAADINCNTAGLRGTVYQENPCVIIIHPLNCPERKFNFLSGIIGRNITAFNVGCRVLISQYNTSCYQDPECFEVQDAPPPGAVLVQNYMENAEIPLSNIVVEPAYRGTYTALISGASADQTPEIRSTCSAFTFSGHNITLRNWTVTIMEDCYRESAARGYGESLFDRAAFTFQNPFSGPVTLENVYASHYATAVAAFTPSQNPLDLATVSVDGSTFQSVGLNNLSTGTDAPYGIPVFSEAPAVVFRDSYGAVNATNVSLVAIMSSDVDVTGATLANLSQAFVSGATPSAVRLTGTVTLIEKVHESGTRMIVWAALAGFITLAILFGCTCCRRQFKATKAEETAVHGTATELQEYAAKEMEAAPVRAKAGVLTDVRKRGLDQNLRLVPHPSSK